MNMSLQSWCWSSLARVRARVRAVVRVRVRLRVGVRAGVRVRNEVELGLGSG